MTKTSSKFYAHQVNAANFKLFQEAGLEEWHKHFSTQFRYAKAWADTGEFTPQEAKVWAQVMEGNPTYALDFKAHGFTPETAAPWFRNTTYNAAHCAKLAAQGRAPRMITQPRPQRTR